MKLLFISSWYPYPPDNGSKLRIYNLLRGLAQRHQITLITFADKPQLISPPELTTLCSNIHVIQQRPYNPASLRAVLGLLSPTPRVVVDTYNPLMAELIHRELKNDHHDLVIASQWSSASYSSSFHEMPAIFEEAELGIFESKKGLAPTLLHRMRHELTLLKLRFYLRRLIPNFFACTVVSDAEAALLRRMVPGYQAIEVIPNAINMDDYANVDETLITNTLIFTGSLRYFANRDAMTWFLSEVYPYVQARIADVHVTITGNHVDLPLPPADNVTLTGFVDDVRPLIASSWASLAPIRLGGGTRLKILEAMALRTPVVATSKAAEGLEVKHDEHLLIADTPESYSEAVIRILIEPGLRQRLNYNAQKLIRERYDWAVVMPRYLDLVDRAAKA